VHFFYGSDSVSATFTGNIWEMDSVKHYGTHYYNYLYLKFLIGHEATSPSEKIQARKEVPIASKKCDTWYMVARQQNRLDELRKQEALLKSQWGT